MCAGCWQGSYHGVLCNLSCLVSCYSFALQQQIRRPRSRLTACALPAVLAACLHAPVLVGALYDAAACVWLRWAATADML
jgi:hypothetical protein